MKTLITKKEAIAAGLKRYFTGKACKRGHVSERTLSGKCVACAVAYGKEYSRSDKAKQARQRWYRNNPDKVLNQWRKWGAENKARRSELNAEYYQRHKRKKIRQATEWTRKNPDKARANWCNSRLRRKNAEGRHTGADLARIRKLQKNRCAYCREKLVKALTHVDHIKPISKGGTNHANNLQLLCRRCNQTKHAKDPIEYARSRNLLI